MLERKPHSLLLTISNRTCKIMAIENLLHSLLGLWVKAGDSFELQPQIVVRAARGGPCIAGIVSRGGPATRCKKISCPYGLRCSLDSTGGLFDFMLVIRSRRTWLSRGSVARIMIAEDRESMRT